MEEQHVFDSNKIYITITSMTSKQMVKDIQTTNLLLINGHDGGAIGMSV